MHEHYHRYRLLAGVFISQSLEDFLPAGISVPTTAVLIKYHCQSRKRVLKTKTKDQAIRRVFPEYIW